ncbi:DUF1003 domain-containing protein [Paenibacillus cymbidii]|uniref:DUF1003 domain-containing protein n=1 Tax=Paenibacillus cymbidii TaxID=1639034 RepID=UPI001A9BECDC|nr:DUF1003 domain-containing protein [Paenibacillus cymbidii]
MDPKPATDEELLIADLEETGQAAAEGTLSIEQLKRVSEMVNDYHENIKCHLSAQQQKKTGWPDRLADMIASFGGSWTFIVSFAAFMTVWILWNLFTVLKFDAPPFILLNLMLSMIAAFQAPIILMSQNRQAARDKQESILSFAINYQAELENNELKHLLQRIEKKLDRLERSGGGDSGKRGNEADGE